MNKLSSLCSLWKKVSECNVISQILKHFPIHVISSRELERVHLFPLASVTANFAIFSTDLAVVHGKFDIQPFSLLGDLIWWNAQKCSCLNCTGWPLLKPILHIDTKTAKIAKECPEIPQLFLVHHFEFLIHPVEKIIYANESQCRGCSVCSVRYKIRDEMK